MAKIDRLRIRVIFIRKYIVACWIQCWLFIHMVILDVLVPIFIYVQLFSFQVLALNVNSLK